MSPLTERSLVRTSIKRTEKGMPPNIPFHFSAVPFHALHVRILYNCSMTIFHAESADDPVPETSDYYITTDNTIPEKTKLCSFAEWELIFYKNYFPDQPRITYTMYLAFIEWHYQFLRYRYTR